MVPSGATSHPGTTTVEGPQTIPIDMKEKGPRNIVTVYNPGVYHGHGPDHQGETMKGLMVARLSRVRIDGITMIADYQETN